MKTLISTLLLTVALTFSLSALADVYVNGYYRSNGTYVQPHYRSDPNGTTLDNWSTKGNTNPYTGKSGTKDPGSSLYKWRDNGNGTRCYYCTD